MKFKKDELIMPERRKLIRNAGMIGVAAAASTMGISRSAMAYELTPTTTEGPYCLTTELFRSDIRTSTTGTFATVDGFPLLLTLKVGRVTSSGNLSPVSGAVVDIWHCNALGHYSGVTNGNMSDETEENWLRGYQVTNRRGSVRFISIYPGWYTSRSIHIHIRIRLFDENDNTTYDQTTQLFFDDSLVQEFMLKAPYTSNTQTLTYNTGDSIYAGAMNNVARVNRRSNYLTASMNILIDPEAGDANLSCPTEAEDDTSGNTGGGPGGEPPSGGTIFM